MNRIVENLLPRRKGIAVILTGLACFSGISQVAAAETVTIGDYMAPNGEGSTWIYSRSNKGSPRSSTFTRISVVEDYYHLAFPKGRAVLASQKLEERGTLKNGLFVGFTGKKRQATYTYSGTEDLYRFYGTDEPVPGSPDKTKNRVLLNAGFATGPTMEVGQETRNRTLVYRSDKLLGYTFLTMELIGKSPIKVPAGTFPDCIHLRFAIGLEDDADVAEEWWAKGVGLVKWKGIAGTQKGISEALVSSDIQEVIQYVAPGFELAGEHLAPGNSGGHVLIFPTDFVPGSQLHESVVVRNTGSETLEGVSVKLINNQYFKLDPFEKQDLAPGGSVTVTVRVTIPSGSFNANSTLRIGSDDRAVDPIFVPMSLNNF